MIFAGYKGSKNQVRNRLKIQFVENDFSKLIFQKSSTDQQGIGLGLSYIVYLITFQRWALLLACKLMFSRVGPPFETDYFQGWDPFYIGS